LTRGLLATLLVAAGLAGAVPARAAPGLEVALQDDAVFVDQYWYGRAAALDRAQQLDVTWIRANVIWAEALPHGQAARRKRPRGLRWDFRRWDALIDAAAERGIRVELTLTGPAPAWATGNHQIGPNAPSIAAWRQFVHRAVAHFRGRVSRYTIWNEPNYVGWLQPSREAPYLYRRLYLAAWSQIHRVDPSARVLIGETSPYAIGHKAWSPLGFLRAASCVDGRFRRLRGCHGKLVADGYAQHPYNYENPPTYRYPGRDNVTIGTLRRLTAELDHLRRVRALATRNGRPMPLYLTEFGYFTFGYRRQPEPRRARYEAQAFRIAQRNPRVRQLLQYQLVEPPPDSSQAFWKTYLIRFNGHLRETFLTLLSWTRDAAAAGRIARSNGPIALPAAPRNR
jgi:hypothetical protein